VAESQIAPADSGAPAAILPKDSITPGTLGNIQKNDWDITQYKIYNPATSIKKSISAAASLIQKPAYSRA
jgi:hypothetical protein